LGHQFVLEFDFQVAEITRNTSEKAEEKAEEGSKDDSKDIKDKDKSDSTQPADKKAFLVTEKFLVDVLGVSRCNISITTAAFSKISLSSSF